MSMLQLLGHMLYSASAEQISDCENLDTFERNGMLKYLELKT